MMTTNPANLNKKNSLGFLWLNKNFEELEILLNNRSEKLYDNLSQENLKLLWQYFEHLISSNVLKKEYYPNNEDNSNEEIDCIWQHSASSIQKRLEEWKWIFYMNPCVSQTLYLINILREKVPDLEKKMRLCIEFLSIKKSDVHSVHAYIQIKLSPKKSIIIDYAHDNDVFIYEWWYTNKSGSNAINSDWLVSIPVEDFTKECSIIDIANNYFWKLEREFNQKWLRNQQINSINKMIEQKIKKLKSDNTSKKFEIREKNHPNLKIHNELNN